MSSQRNLWVASMCRAREKCRNLDLTVSRTGPHDGGAGTAVADAPGGPEVGEHLPNESPEDICSCRGFLRQITGSAGKPVDCGDTRRRFRRRDLAQCARRRGSESAAIAATAEAGVRLANKQREKALTGGRDPQMNKVSNEPKNYHRDVYTR